MGITLANFYLLGTKPVARDIFIIWVIGTAIILIECFSTLLYIMSWPKIDLYLNVRVVSIIVDGVIGSKTYYAKLGLACNLGNYV